MPNTIVIQYTTIKDTKKETAVYQRAIYFKMVILIEAWYQCCLFHKKYSMKQKLKYRSANQYKMIAWYLNSSVSMKYLIKETVLL